MVGEASGSPPAWSHGAWALPRHLDARIRLFGTRVTNPPLSAALPDLDPALLRAELASAHAVSGFRSADRGSPRYRDAAHEASATEVYGRLLPAARRIGRAGVQHLAARTSRVLEWAACSADNAAEYSSVRGAAAAGPSAQLLLLNGALDAPLASLEACRNVLCLALCSHGGRFEREKIDFSWFPDLVYLELSGDFLVRVPAGVGGLTRLRVLALGGNALGSLAGLESLTSLEVLRVGDNPLAEEEIGRIKAALPGCEVLA